MKKTSVIILSVLVIFSGFPTDYLSSKLSDFKVVDKSFFNSPPLALPRTEAAAKTKTIEFFVGSVLSTTATASAATTTFSFVISLPDMVPNAQPIRSAYILYNTHYNSATSISASGFTLQQQGGVVQNLASPPALANSGENQELAFRLDATAAMRNIIGNASGTYAMYFKSNITGPTRIGEGAELFVTYDYDPFAPTQVNNDYRFVFATSSQMGKALATSPAFNFSLPESAATTTFSVGATSTNQFWAEFRARISTSTAVTVGLGWDAEATSAATFANAADTYSILMFSQPVTANASPSASHTLKMQGTSLNVVNNPNAVAIAAYTFNFNASSKLRKNIQVLLMQDANVSSTATIQTTSTINISETSPSSTGAFLMGRTNFIGTASNPGINAAIGPGAACTGLTTTPITEGAPSTDTTGFSTPIWNTAANLAFTTSGNKVICSSFSASAATNIRGLKLFLSYDYANSPIANARLNNYVSFLADSNINATGTTFADTNINSSLANSSATSMWSWLDAEYDNSNTGNAVPTQVLTLGINGVPTSYAFPGTGENTYGESFSATSTAGFSSSVSSTVQCGSPCINDARYDVYGQTDILPSNFTENHYHWRNDDGSESTSTAAASEDTSLAITGAGTVKRLRFEISNNGDATSSASFRIEYQANATSGIWVQLATSTAGTSEWQMSTSTLVTDGTATTNITTSTGGTTDGNIIFNSSEVVASLSRNQSAAKLLSGVRFTEVEYSIMPTSNASSATYYFRVSNAGTALTTYSVYASASFSTASTVSCSVSTSTTSFGNIDISAVYTSSPNASTSMTCDGALGCTLYVQDSGSGSKPGLYMSVSPTYLIKSPDTAFDATTTLTANTDGYGIQAATTTAGSGAILGLNNRYLQSGNTVGGLATTTITVASSTGAVTGREVLITHKAAAGPNALGGSYSDTITYSCVSN